MARAHRNQKSSAPDPAQDGEASGRTATGPRSSSPPALVRHGAARFSRWLALSVVVLAPLPFGSVDPSWIAAWCAAMAVSLALARIPELSPAQMRVLFAVLGAYACLLLAVELRFLEFTPDPVRARGDLLTGGADVAQRPLPLAEMGSSLLMVLVFCRLFLLGCGGAESRQVLRAIAWSGLGYALYGMLAFAFDPAHILWRPKTAYLGNLTGTFVNRNTAATYFGSISVLWAIMLVSAIRSEQTQALSARERLWLVLSGRDMTLLGCLFGTLLCLGATAATGSRAGFLLTLAALLLVAVVHGRLGWRHLRHRWLVIGAGLAAILTLEMLGGLVTARLRSVGFEDGSRLEVYRASLSLIAARPWLGWGLGSFEDVFAPLRPESAGISGVWDRAHSTPLELAIELGLPAALAICGLWISLFGALLRGWLRTGSPMIIAGCVVGLLGSLHSSIDFSLQIPGFAVTFAALTAVGLAQARSEAPEKSTEIDLFGRRARRRPGARKPRNPG